MRLIGMLDSPYVRRVAISLAVMDIPFEHQSLSVFGQFDEFARINPVVKAPTLVTTDGVTLMESTLILEYLTHHVARRRRLMPDDTREFAQAQRVIGLALAACEKTVQIVYEQKLRPPEKQHQPWVDRVRGQLTAAYETLDQEMGSGTPWLHGSHPLQADITTAVAWRFTQGVLPGYASPDNFPRLATLSARAEALAEFQAWPWPS